MNYNYIKSNDEETIKTLRRLGFVVLEECGGFTTFLNNPTTIKKFTTDDMKYTFTNKLEL